MERSEALKRARDVATGFASYLCAEGCGFVSKRKRDKADGLIHGPLVEMCAAALQQVERETAERAAEIAYPKCTTQLCPHCGGRRNAAREIRAEFWLDQDFV